MGRGLTTDPNWLLSTTAMSSAALVAIVGGFLVSRVVALATERQALDRRIRELGGLLTVKNAEFDEVSRERRAVSEEYFERHHLNDFIEAREDEEVIEASLGSIPIGSSEEEMRPYARQLLERVREAFSVIEAKYPLGAAPPTRAEQLRQDGIAVDVDAERIYERVAAAVASGRQRRPWSVLSSIIPSAPVSELLIKRQDDRIAKERDLQAEVRAIEAERGIVQEARRRLHRPKELWTAVVVLAYFAVVGAVFPLTVMAVDPVPRSDVIRGAVVLAFVSGLSALIWFVARTIGSLRSS